MHLSVGAPAEKAPPDLLPPSLAFWGSPLKDSHPHLGAAWPVGSGTEHWAEGGGWGGTPKSHWGLVCGMACTLLRVCTVYLVCRDHLYLAGRQDVGTLGFLLGPGCGDHMHHVWGCDLRTFMLLLGSGYRDYLDPAWGRDMRPSHSAQGPDTGTFWS